MKYINIQNSDISIYIVLFEHSYSHPFAYCLWLLFATTAELNSVTMTLCCTLTKLFTIWPITEKKSVNRGLTYLKTKSFFKMFYVYLFFKEREREKMQAGEGPRERETQNWEQAPGPELSAQS